ncbi:branched-chain amino acid ABC transporter permease [Pyrodictium abyssi]|uniref:Branched-chain amino acid ABC transporter permease n=1 Tax=Pyrodictium abyssi TaxID=54256 RepID=A0ABM8IVL6_9CREN|nr:branched-chain amino acid ABC transporter permease [Pyrodictium abyssi]
MEGVMGIVSQWIVWFGVYAILALSFNLEYGYGGVPNFGKVLFMSLGAYSAGALAAWLGLHWAAQTAGATVAASTEGPVYCSPEAYNILSTAASQHLLSPGQYFTLFALALVAAGVIGAVSGILSSYPTLRLGGDFLAITLLAMGEVVRLIAYNSQWPVCSFNGLTAIPTPFAWYPVKARIDLMYAMLVLLFAALFYVYAEMLANSPWGRALKAMRDDELAAQVYGYNVARLRLQVLAVGSAMAAIAGALLVFYSGSVQANTFKPERTFEVVVAVMLGGAANNVGALLGAAAVAAINVFLNTSALETLGISVPDAVAAALPFLRYVIMGLLIVAVLLYRPQGLIPEKPLRTPLVELTIKRLQKVIGKETGSLPVDAPERS